MLIQRQYNVEAHADMYTLLPIPILAYRKTQHTHTSKGMRNISHPEGIYRCNAQDYIWKLRSFDSSRTKRQVNAFILCRDTFIPLTFSPILTLESRLKRLPMPRHGVSECSIGCKGNEKNDYSRIFSWLFFIVRIKTNVWAHKEALLRPYVGKE